MKTLFIVVSLILVFASSVVIAQDDRPQIYTSILSTNPTISVGVDARRYRQVYEENAPQYGIYAHLVAVNAIHAEADAKFLAALEQLHDANPILFDSIMRDNHIGIQFP